LHPANVHPATALELQQPGMDPTTADQILKMRKSYGLFKSVDDLDHAVSVIVVELAATLKLSSVIRADAFA
jgi:DNA uptake protein ComE-like DNA-binding protein